MESCTREQTTNLYSVDLESGKLIPVPYEAILLHYGGKIYELASGAVYREGTYFHASGEWAEIEIPEYEGENPVGIELSQEVFGLFGVGVGEPWIPTQEELESVDNWPTELGDDDEPLGEAFLREFEELIREDNKSREEERNLVHKPRPRYGV